MIKGSPFLIFKHTTCPSKQIPYSFARFICLTKFQSRPFLILNILAKSKRDITLSSIPSILPTVKKENSFSHHTRRDNIFKFLHKANHLGIIRGKGTNFASYFQFFFRQNLSLSAKQSDAICNFLSLFAGLNI